MAEQDDSYIVDLRKKKEREAASSDQEQFSQISITPSFKKTSGSKKSRQKIKKMPIPHSITWRAPEFTKYEKDASWTFWLLVLIAAPTVYAIFTKNFLMVIIFVITGFLFYSYGHGDPKLIRFSITPKGVLIDERLYNFDDLKSFWIFYSPPEIKEISFRSKKSFMPYIKIPLGSQEPVKIRRTLLRYLPERKQQESVVEHLSRQFRF